MFNKHRQETLIYLVLWGILFITPVMSLYIRSISGHTFDWSEVMMVWRRYGIYFAFFLVHNHLLAPLLVYKQRKAAYFSISGVLVVLFTFYQCSNEPARLERRGPRPEMMGNHRPPEFEEHRPPEFEDGEPSEFEDQKPSEFEDHRPPEPKDREPKMKPDGQRPPVALGQHDIIAIVVLILMLAANLGIKLYFRQRHDQRQLAELEHKNLEQQLEYLKYQLNPHFLMNTLNNIHALVDINPEQAKEAVIDLSKILRYVLYESNQERVPMSKEREFMENYITLMRMRYGDKLSFSTSLLDDVTGITVPPLLFISFVENAFKHGVSYQKPSFIAIESKRYKDKLDHDRLLWTCRNSKHTKPETTTIPRQGGVGMANIRQRLNLIYGSNYSLGFNETADTYEVMLDIPLDF